MVTGLSASLREACNGNPFPLMAWILSIPLVIAAVALVVLIAVVVF